jgi:hypothetical protein
MTHTWLREHAERYVYTGDKLPAGTTLSLECGGHNRRTKKPVFRIRVQHGDKHSYVEYHRPKQAYPKGTWTIWWAKKNAECWIEEHKHESYA